MYVLIKASNFQLWDFGMRTPDAALMAENLKCEALARDQPGIKFYSPQTRCLTVWGGIFPRKQQYGIPSTV